MQGVRFYKVIDVPHPRKVTVVQINGKMVSGDWMGGQIEPVDITVDPTDQGITYMVDMSSGKPVCKTGSSIDRMTRWSGKPVDIWSD